MSVNHFDKRSVTFKHDKLCQDCKSLGLSVDKFLIASSKLARSIGLSPTAASSRDQTGLSRIVAPSRLQLNSGFGQKTLGKLSEIKARSTEQGCSLCKLVWTAVERYSKQVESNSENNVAFDEGAESESNSAQGVDGGSDLEPSETKGNEPDVDPASYCFMVWEVDGRQARGSRTGTTIGDEEDTQYSNVSRRIRFWWKQRDGKIQESYILFVPPPDPMVPNADASGFQRGKWSKAEFLAREFDPEKTQYALIGSWLNICDKHEPKCTEVYEPDRFENLRTQTWFGVIDVVQMKLCSLPDPLGYGRSLYVALSYVWGPPPDPKLGQDHRTLRANVSGRTYPGGIEERKLPKTIRQAIQLTRDLGLRYIWIDSLCIVQDSYSSFKLNAERMDLIYRNAHLTICAADGAGSWEGLSALDPLKAERPIAQYVEGIKLQVSRPSESVIRDSVWNQRGWTFQERILSPRCLVFVKGRFYFQCRKSNMSQDIYPDPTGNGLSMDWMNSPLRTLSGLKTRPIWLYMTCVSLYTGRHLTKPGDILPAFEGVAGLMRTRMHGELAGFLYGLPPSHFDLALLWEPLSAQKRRKPSKDTKKDDRYVQVDTELPSWSWAGWTDASIDRKTSSVGQSTSSAEEKSKDSSNDKGSQVKYKNETLDGCFTDVHEWLIQHTWIQWFIRNNSGDLRPVWSRQAMSEVDGVLPRWRGYAVAGDIHTEIKIRGRERENWTDGYSSIPPGPRYSSHSDDEDAPSFRDSYVRGPEVYQQRREEGEVEREVEIRRAAGNERDRLLRHIKNLERRLELTGAPTEDGTFLRDDYGRKVRGLVRNEWPRFTHSISDNPFGVKMVNFDDSRSYLPDQAILQFYTLRAQFYILPNDEATQLSPPGDGLVRCDVADENNDWCGHIILNEDWARPRRGAKCHFIALSEAKSFTHEECRNWAHYIPRDQEDVEWDLFFVLLIEWKEKRLLWERVGLGKVFQVAFKVGGSEQQEEILLG